MLLSCQNDAPKESEYVRITGPTMGTVYECIFDGSGDKVVIQSDVDSLLELVNAAASTYIPTSLISQFNQSTSGLCRSTIEAEMFHFSNILAISDSVVKQSDGYFDPTLMPLVNYWGFGYKDRMKRSVIESDVMDSILSYVGYRHLEVNAGRDSTCIRKVKAQLELDLSAVAKGYGVDLLAKYFADIGSENYYVNIGGEIVVVGKNQHGKSWTLGINYPDTAAQLTELFAKVAIDAGAMATSGNYRNFYSSGGQQIVHTINPRTGEATPSDLVSVTIITTDCARADALATACMAMGYSAAKSMIEADPSVDAFFIYTNTARDGLRSYTTSGLSDKLKLN